MRTRTPSRSEDLRNLALISVTGGLALLATGVVAAVAFSGDPAPPAPQAVEVVEIQVPEPVLQLRIEPEPRVWVHFAPLPPVEPPAPPEPADRR